MQEKTMIHLTVSKDLKKKAQKVAEDMGISLNSIIRISLNEYLKNK